MLIKQLLETHDPLSKRSMLVMVLKRIIHDSFHGGAPLVLRDENLAHDYRITGYDDSNNHYLTLFITDKNSSAVRVMQYSTGEIETECLRFEPGSKYRVLAYSI